MNIWQKLKKSHTPFFALAPMADVTDIAFRQIIAKYSESKKPHGGPHVFYTEFVSVNGLTSSKGFEKVSRDLNFSKTKEQPIIAQVFGIDPEKFYTSAKIIKKLGFDGIDINMGCPEKKIISQGAGSALIKTPELAKAIIKATIKGAGSMPVSVKTRIGYNKITTKDWINNILSTKPAALAIHGRTKKEMSDVPAHWDEIKLAANLAKNSKTIIIGNGDVTSLEDGIKKANQSRVDGIMVGRGVFGNPWFFNSNRQDQSQQEKLQTLIEHTKLFEKLLVNKKIKSFAVMKKHFKAYCSGWSGAKELRIQLMQATDSSKLSTTINHYLTPKK